MVGAKRRIRIADHGHITLPADLMHKHRLNPGDEVDVADTDQGVLITPPVGKELMHTEREATAFTRPSAEEIARRQAVFADLMASRQERDIRPLTSLELIRLARTEEGRADDPGT